MAGHNPFEGNVFDPLVGTLLGNDARDRAATITAMKDYSHLINQLVPGFGEGNFGSFDPGKQMGNLQSLTGQLGGIGNQLASLQGDAGRGFDTAIGRLGGLERETGGRFDESFNKFGALGRESGSIFGALGNRLAGLERETGGRFDESFNKFGALGRESGSIFGALGNRLAGLERETGGRFDQLINEQQGIAGGEDPRFEAFRQTRMGEFDFGANRQMRQQGDELARLGVTGSVALNQQNRIQEGLNFQRGNLTGRLGRQQMGRQDIARNRAARLSTQRQSMLAGLQGQQAGLSGQRQSALAGILGSQADLSTQRQSMLALQGQQAGLSGQRQSALAGILGSQADLSTQRQSMLAGLQGQQAGSRLGC